MSNVNMDDVEFIGFIDAARTELIKIVVNGPLPDANKNPIRLAEEIAAVDTITGSSRPRGDTRTRTRSRPSRGW
ncbi:hypothetical protein ACFPZL_11235 [Leucobacter soli]|uniref:Uncharacterized protein n=1 Tax=Leucobacter soli TaxID=2812850 RepID=A0A916JST2_9MICO|nr:hypothetical protein [Leucobacter soli]CAG7600264.1 hypothetical protein LEUCIP111803_00371 [Leucobacter soli]